MLARFGFMHLMATNVSLWVRTVVWESANEWLHYLHHQQRAVHGDHVTALPTALSQVRGSYIPSYDLDEANDYSYFDDDNEVPNLSNNLDYISGNFIHQ